jgi:ribosome-binding protein aMBF1 (putative translation factor)
MPISESDSQHRVAIGGQTIEVRVTQIALNVWRACAVFMGEHIVQSGRSEEQALAHWTTVAQLIPEAGYENREGRA